MLKIGWKQRIYWYIIILLLRIHGWRLKEKIIKLRGLKLYIPRNVFYPVRTFSTELILEYLDKILKNSNNLCLCDIGTGTGVIGLFAAKRGVRVVASDISPTAVKASRINAILNDCRIDIRLCDLFECFDNSEKFDIIIFNPPYFPIRITDEFSMTYAAGENYEIIIRFLREAKNHLKPNGYVLITLTSLVDTELIFQIARKIGYKVELINKVKGLPKEEIRLYKLSLSS